ncbi:MAG: T9SS type A sorting domain-containing protein [Flavobacteriales bacterium]
MKTYRKILLSLIILIFSSGTLLSKAPPSYYSKKNKEEKSSAAGCSPATSSAFLALNNVRALIQSGGDMWWDFRRQRYEVPKGSGTHSIFAGSLWMGGRDVNKQLKIAALRFRQGNDYWTGPLTTDGKATIDPQTCEKWDEHFRITLQEVKRHRFCVTFGGDCPDYVIPESIMQWPAHGNVSKGQAKFLAPFFDANNNGLYEPTQGDYPYYDIDGDLPCNSGNRATNTLFGDETLWWIFNDKGNSHTESGGDPIGMEVRAQAFAFATNDAVNNMTFYNYELINRGSQTLTETFFGQWVDSDLGGAFDDYVGCDVQRGLGFGYNGDNNDEGTSSQEGYGETPPAVGVDFFEGPFQDRDSMDNPLTKNLDSAYALDGIPYDGIGIGYGDGIIDNERLGMRHFFYHENCGGTDGPRCDPQKAPEYYNLMRGFWRNNAPMVYGGQGITSPGATNVQTNYMFPGNSDPLGFGQGGKEMPKWTEVTAGNNPGDRRFFQSAGPFTLKPGDVNNITVGVVWSRANSGGNTASVQKMKVDDKKAQSLFDNCFELLEGPDAPVVEVKELNKKLVLTLKNPKGLSNNANEQWKDEDPFLPEFEVNENKDFDTVDIDGDGDTTDVVLDTTTLDTNVFDRTFRFQGYQIWQVKNPSEFSTEDLDNPSKARKIIQVDKEDDVTRITNFEFDSEIGEVVPVVKADSVNNGLRHSFLIEEDRFAKGDDKLVNHTEYHFIALAYAYNNYKDYDPSDPTKLNGQKEPYLQSRKSARGTEIEPVTGIPHLPDAENNGTVLHSEYGDGVKITRIEGQGNGGNVIDFTESTEEEVVEDIEVDHPTYKAGKGPVDVKVIDPLNVPDADFRLRIKSNKDREDGNILTDSAYWELTNLTTDSTVTSKQTIDFKNEQIITEWGISVSIDQPEFTTNDQGGLPEMLESSIEYKDSSKRWLSGVQDVDACNQLNWIRSGTAQEGQCSDNGTTDGQEFTARDPNEQYESIVNGTWTHFSLLYTGDSLRNQPLGFPNAPPKILSSGDLEETKILHSQSVNIVFTPDTSKWTRCPVFEMQDDPNLAEGNVDKLYLRDHKSVNKEGEPDGTGTKGMGWFPGYAVSLETGKRLNMAFGEDSRLKNENGNDMIWNPTSTMATPNGSRIFGGKHVVFVFNDSREEDTSFMPAYDKGKFIHERLKDGYCSFCGETSEIWKSCMWVGMPMLAEGEELLSTEAKIRIRIAQKYAPQSINNPPQNKNKPLYEFNTGEVAAETNNKDHLKNTVLDTINIVPNPYYAFSEYEKSSLQNTVKITNLPQEAEIKIYDVSGTLIRQFSKDSPKTYLKWDLKNSADIPIASGTYLIHVKVPGVGETVLKWFGAIRPPDVNTF